MVSPYAHLYVSSRCFYPGSIVLGVSSCGTPRRHLFGSLGFLVPRSLPQLGASSLSYLDLSSIWTICFLPLRSDRAPLGCASITRAGTTVISCSIHHQIFHLPTVYLDKCRTKLIPQPQQALKCDRVSVPQGLDECPHFVHHVCPRNWVWKSI